MFKIFFIELKGMKHINEIWQKKKSFFFNLMINSI